MDTIEVHKSSENEFKVVVHSSVQSEHLVTVPPDFYMRLTGGKVSPETLVKHSFEFLLQREPNTSILSRFELPLIGHYFPGYEKTIRSML
jgi:hypothetical protein